MSKRKLLVISAIPSGFNKFFFEGKLEFNGMPAFKEVFIHLLEDERLDYMHLLLWVTEAQKGNVVIPEKYKDKIKFKEFFYDRANPLRSVLSFFRVFFYSLYIVATNKIYKIGAFRSHSGAVAALVGFLTGKKNTRRIYGSFLINEIEDSKFKLFIKHPFEYLSYYVPKGDVVITNDGTKGDIVYNKLGNKKNKLHFPLNGINKLIHESLKNPDADILHPEYFIYVARVADWKRQHLLIESLHILKSKNIDFLHTYIVGPVTDEKYYNSLKELITKYDLHDNLTFLGGLPTDQSNYMIKHAKLSFSLYHTSNLGNVFLESITLGTPVIAINSTGSLNAFPRDIYIPVDTEEPKDIAQSIIDSKDDSILLRSIHDKAVEYSSQNLKSWPERAKLETDLLLA